MTCTCVRDNEPRIAAHYAKQLGVPATAEARGMAMVFGKTLSEKPFMPYAVKADKPGYRGAKGKEISMFFNFCPFCGVKIEKEAEL